MHLVAPAPLELGIISWAVAVEPVSDEETQCNVLILALTIQSIAEP